MAWRWTMAPGTSHRFAPFGETGLGDGRAREKSAPISLAASAPPTFSVGSADAHGGAWPILKLAANLKHLSHLK